jgi:thiamine pyrophosphate-dependent acetolactate synthase large subunit-like protein
MPDEHCDSHGGEVVAKVLQAHGVKHIFTLIGGHISPILVASKKLGITVVDFRHEVNAVFAADAMSRLTGITGVAAVTAGPGVTNTITAVKNAQMAQSPLVLIGGAAPTILKVPLAFYLHHLLHSNAALGPRLSAGCGSAFHSSFLVQVQRLSQQLA